MKLRRILSTLLAGALCAALLSACGQAPAESKAESKAAESTATESATSDASGETGGETKELSGKLTIWDWDEAALNEFTQNYMDRNKNVQIDKLVVATADYMQKFQAAVASGTDVPDVVMTEMAYRGQLFELGVLEDLSKDPYSVKKEDMFDFAWSLGSGPNGELYGVEQQICPTGFAYRRDLAKQYLGTDDPDEIAKLIPDWDSFVKLGKEIKEKSGGKVFIFSGIDEMLGTLRYQNPFDYIDGDTLDITGRYKEMFDVACNMNKEGIFANLTGPALNSSYAEGSVLFYRCAPWSCKWGVETNDPNGKGNWALTKMPGDSGATYGGTSVSIYSGSQSKELAWDYIQDTYCTGENVKVGYEKFGFLTGFKAPYDDKSSYYYTTPSAYDEFFGGQKLTDFFVNKISLELKGQVQKKNESFVSTAFAAVNPQLVESKDISSDEALELLKKELQILLPSATIK